MTRNMTLLAGAALVVLVAACAGSGAVATPAAETSSTATIEPTTGAPPTTEVTPTLAAEMQPGVTIERDLPFATYDGTTLTLDLHLPSDPVAAPIAFGPEALAEEGAIVPLDNVEIGDPPDNDDEGVRFLGDHGAWVRLGAEVMACEIRFARARASELGSDDPIVVLGGHSQGGGVTAHVALFGATLDERWDEFAAAAGGPPRQVECLVAGQSTRVDGLVDTAGTYDLYVPVIEGLYGRSYQQAFDPELQQFLASAIGANPELVVRLFHGTSDRAIPATVSEDFAAALASAGYDVQYTPFDGGHSSPPDEVILPVFKELLGL
jgi:hypothetical protein